MFIKTILFTAFVSTHINAASGRLSVLQEAKPSVSSVPLFAADVKQREQNELLKEINSKIQNTYNKDELKTYIEEKLHFASERDYSRVISRLAPESLRFDIIPSQSVYKTLLNKVAGKGYTESLIILADICANDKLFEDIRDEVAFNNLSPLDRMRTNKILFRSFTTLATLNACRIMIYDGFDVYEILFQTCGIIAVGNCFFPVHFVSRSTNTPTYNTDNLMEAYRIALNNQQRQIVESLAVIIRQRKPNATLPQANFDFV